jgi:hypothetical protein
VKAAELLPMGVEAEPKPVPIQNGAEHFIEVGKVQIILHGHNPDHLSGSRCAETARIISRLKGALEIIPSA